MNYEIYETLINLWVVDFLVLVFVLGTFVGTGGDFKSHKGYYGILVVLAVLWVVLACAITPWEHRLKCSFGTITTHSEASNNA